MMPRVLPLAALLLAVSAQADTTAIDHSGTPQYGKGTYYPGRHPHRGTPAAPGSAASKTLPLGTKAQVTNLANGQSAEVEVNDRGPTAPGRIIDVTPDVASKLGIKDAGVAPVEVKPLAVPQPDGQVKDTSQPK